MNPRDLASYVFLAVAWGASFLAVSRVIPAFGWVGAVSFRALIASATLFLAARAIGRRLDFSFGIVPLVVVGATTVAGQLILLSYSLPLIGTAMSAIMVATIPLFSMLIARLWGVERLGPAGTLGGGLGLVGMMLLVGFPSRPITPDFMLGCACMVVAAVSAAFGSVYAGRRLRHAGAWEVTIGSFLVGGLLTLPLVRAVPVPAWPAPVDYLMLLITGTVMSAMTYALYFRLITTIGPTRAISVEFAVTGVAVLIGTLLLGEHLSPVQMAGGAAIAVGCALVLGLVPGRRGRIRALAFSSDTDSGSPDVP
ncbi:drug/metabolite transporter (DMT)-like permease [Angulomicrobium tetraedrale]|uniref:Drug/metabolite transporter (DMT)-like permease n=1 Tax=Ancylobacter tetraedralis TaxID=217068 RepID=A0A839Z2E6_9HYPH|nr:DMT family transporter [Ancylobacter tetraedralis]MBB3769789.1 drug/metabolite transporter (DMT)-like permease [Ancylobacter tetraedralis]